MLLVLQMELSLPIENDVGEGINKRDQCHVQCEQYRRNKLPNVVTPSCAPRNREAGVAGFSKYRLIESLSNQSLPGLTRKAAGSIPDIRSASFW